MSQWKELSLAHDNTMQHRNREASLPTLGGCNFTGAWWCRKAFLNTRPAVAVRRSGLTVGPAQLIWLVRPMVTDRRFHPSSSVTDSFRRALHQKDERGFRKRSIWRPGFAKTVARESPTKVQKCHKKVEGFVLVGLSLSFRNPLTVRWCHFPMQRSCCRLQRRGKREDSVRMG